MTEEVKAVIPDGLIEWSWIIFQAFHKVLVLCLTFLQVTVNKLSRVGMGYIFCICWEQICPVFLERVSQVLQYLREFLEPF